MDMDKAFVNIYKSFKNCITLTKTTNEIKFEKYYIILLNIYLPYEYFSRSNVISVHIWLLTFFFHVVKKLDVCFSAPYRQKYIHKCHNWTELLLVKISYNFYNIVWMTSWTKLSFNKRKKEGRKRNERKKKERKEEWTKETKRERNKERKRIVV